jgi:single-strand DNA-binding protein
MTNHVQLIGRIGADPEVKNVKNDSKLARFNLATNSYYTNASGEKEQRTTWHRVIAWGAQAKTISDFCKKGQELMISGKLVNNNWEDKDGNTRYQTEVEAKEILLLRKPN